LEEYPFLMITRKFWEGDMFDKRSLALAIVLAVVLVLVVGAASAQEAVTLTDLEQLGKSIYFDQALSINENLACAGCHQPVSGWTGPDPAINTAGAVYEGSISGRFGNRKPPSSAYATQSPILYMDKKRNLDWG
jgi:cytochrome c peroxidase